jgi:hypothetical protein
MEMSEMEKSARKMHLRCACWFIRAKTAVRMSGYQDSPLLLHLASSILLLKRLALFCISRIRAEQELEQEQEEEERKQEERKQEERRCEPWEYERSLHSECGMRQVPWPVNEVVHAGVSHIKTILLVYSDD